MKYIIGAATVVFSSYAYALGFRSGNVLMATNYMGQVSVQCVSAVGPVKAAQFSCLQSTLKSGDFDFFEASNVPADQVILTSLWPDGSSRTRKVSYDPSLQSSAKKVNLWSRRLGQSPLLAIGNNLIYYEMVSSQGAVLERGNFSVDVRVTPNQHCEDLSFLSPDSEDCDSPYTMCEKYFLNVRNCK